jgi:hypothetical protein
MLNSAFLNALVTTDAVDEQIRSRTPPPGRTRFFETREGQEVNQLLDRRAELMQLRDYHHTNEWRTEARCAR